MTVTDYGEIVAALRAVPGVADADVEPDGEGGGLGLLRLGLAPGFDEVQVATSVGRVLRERFGLGVDAERVQLVEDAEVPDDAIGRDGSAPQHRPAIQRMHLVSSGLDISASVTLGFDDRSAVGEAQGTATQSGVQKAVALATLRAIESLVDGKARFELDHLEVTQTGRDRTVVAGVTLVTASGSERLTGAAVVREDVRQAVIRATLDGLNRRLGALLH
ncbi:MAG: hypothetical protein QOE45_1460 [Frankiaceae bacterium]|nr:hypothetical protein [Frankiaceae bacterium]